VQNEDALSKSAPDKYSFELIETVALDLLDAAGEAAGAIVELAHAFPEATRRSIVQRGEYIILVVDDD